MTRSPRHPRLSRSAALIVVAATALVPFLNAPFAQAAESPAARSTASAGGHRLGLKASRGPRIAAAHRLSAMGLAAAEVLPISVDLTAKTITPGNQGAVGSCVAWSEGYTLAGYYANAQSHGGAPFAPMYLYSQVHVANTADGGGAYTSDAWNVLKTQGIAEKSVYTQGDVNFTTMPTTAQIANAALHKMSPASYLFVGANQGSAGIEALKGALASGNPVEIGIPVYSAFTSLNSTNSVLTLAQATGSVLGGHAIVAVGYNPTGLVIENSWGTSWGAAGYATLAWDFVGKYVSEASMTTGFAAVPVVPVVTGLSVSSGSTSGGGTLTISGSALAAVDASSVTAVTLVNSANSSVTVNAPVTSRTVSSLTVTVPAAPVVSGSAVAGAYRVQITSSAGPSVDNGTKDDFTYYAPARFTVSGASTIPAGSGATVTLSGAGFGASATEASALKLSATVSAAPTAVTWVSDTAVKVAVPAGIPGQSIPIVLTRSGVASAVVSTLKYAANISQVSVRSEPSGARYAAVTGRGLAGATGWTLTSTDGTGTTAVPVVTSTTDLAAAGAGVLITGDTSATIKLPAFAPGGVGNFALSFTPNQATYPGATFLGSSAALVPYAGPTITKLTGTLAYSDGGGVLTVSGTNLTAVDRNNPAAVRLVKVGDTTLGVNVPVSAVTGTSLTLTVPAAPTRSGSKVVGDYQLVVTTTQGTVTAPTAVTYLVPFAITVPAGTALLGTGGQLVTVRGSGFGSSADAFRSAPVTALLGGRTAAVTWVNDTTVRVASTATGVPGSTTTLVLARLGLPSNPLTLTYVAAISRLSVSTGPSEGGTLVTVTGVGFSGSPTWTVRSLSGTVLSTLTAVSSAAALADVPSGVYVSSGTAAVIKMPAAAAAGLSAVAIGVSPDQAAYPGATSATTGKAVFVYSDTI